MAVIFSNKYFKLAVLSLAFVLGVGLRLWKYPFYPLTANAEEYLFVRSGLSLIEQKIPISWNDIPVYEESNVYKRMLAKNLSGRGDLGVRLIKPWLDEPPLFSVIEGGISKFYQSENFTVISPYIIRIPPLIFSFLCLILLFLITKNLFGYWTAILTLVIYGTIPTVVFGSRLAVAENMITLFYLIVLYLFLNYQKTGKKWQRNLAIFLAGITGLAKPTGFLIVPFLGYLLWVKRGWKEGVRSLVAGLLIFVIPFFGYGFYFDRDLFLKVMSYQSQRPAGWSGLAYIFTNPGYSIEVFLDGFLVVGFLALIYLIFKKRNESEEFVLFTFVYTLLTVIISGGRHDQLCWYRYPIYPFMSIAISLLVKEIINKPNFYNSAVFIPLFLANLDLLENPFWKLKFLTEVEFYRYPLFLLLLPGVIFMVFKKPVFLKILRLGIVISFIFGIFINVYVIKSRFNLLCDHDDKCALPYKVNLFEPFVK